MKTVFAALLLALLCISADAAPDERLTAKDILNQYSWFN